MKPWLETEALKGQFITSQVEGLMGGAAIHGKGAVIFMANQGIELAPLRYSAAKCTLFHALIR